VARAGLQNWAVPRGTQPLTSPLADQNAPAEHEPPRRVSYLIGGRRSLRSLWSPAPPLAQGWQGPPSLAFEGTPPAEPKRIQLARGPN